MTIQTRASRRIHENTAPEREEFEIVKRDVKRHEKKLAKHQRRLSVRNVGLYIFNVNGIRRDMARTQEQVDGQFIVTWIACATTLFVQAVIVALLYSMWAGATILFVQVVFVVCLCSIRRQKTKSGDGLSWETLSAMNER